MPCTLIATTFHYGQEHCGLIQTCCLIWAKISVDRSLNSIIGYLKKNGVLQLSLSIAACEVAFELSCSNNHALKAIKLIDYKK